LPDRLSLNSSHVHRKSEFNNDLWISCWNDERISSEFDWSAHSPALSRLQRFCKHADTNISKAIHKFTGVGAGNNAVHHFHDMSNLNVGSFHVVPTTQLLLGGAEQMLLTPFGLHFILESGLVCDVQLPSNKKSLPFLPDL
jgi:hypothetical protein